MHKHYGPSVDNWSVGVIAFILLGGYQPFDDNEATVRQYAPTNTLSISQTVEGR